MDSVNVLERAHHLPFFSRLGPHDRSLLHRLAYEDHELFEYWGHAASLVDVELEPALRWRMADGHAWGGPARVAATRPDLIVALEREVHENGPVSAAELDDGDRRTGPWWGWGETKQALEYLFWAGRVGALRRPNFERVYCHPDHAVPAHVRARPTPDERTAKRALLARAARAHGVATAADLADYWRIGVRDARLLVREMAADGELIEVDVDGWSGPAFMHPDTPVPRQVDVAALVSPFDAAMWHRDRVERVHGFQYRIEIYVPEPQRRYGYYVLPFLLGDSYVARLDLKADRRRGQLLVPSAHAEPDLARRGTEMGAVAAALASELRSLGSWLELGEIHVGGRGDLAVPLAHALDGPSEQ